jgi:hypothetical protein
LVAVLPEYKPTATLATQRDMVDRALFNPDAQASRRLPRRLGNGASSPGNSCSPAR